MSPWFNFNFRLTVAALLLASFHFPFRPLPLVRAAHNVTVDDSDTTQIVYSPPTSWRVSPFDPLNAGGRLRITSDPSASAIFTFTGTAVYFYAPLWPFLATTQIELDGAGPVVLNLTDPDTLVPIQDGQETVQSSVAWFADGLNDVLHTFVVSVAPGSEHAVVDGFVYTVLDVGDPTTSIDTGASQTSSSSSSSSSSSPSSSSSSTSFLPRPSTSTSLSSSSSPTAKKGLSIALGIVCTVFALLVLYGARWYWQRRQRLLLDEQEEEEDRRRTNNNNNNNNNNPPTADADADNSENGSPVMDYAYKRQPSGWQRNARGRLIAAPTGITTMIPTVEQGGSLSLGLGLAAGSGTSSNSSLSNSNSGGGGRGQRKGPRRHGPSPLSMSMSPSTTPSTSATSSLSGSTRAKGKKPLTTIPEMRMREDDAIRSPASAALSSSSTKFGVHGNGDGEEEEDMSPFADAPRRGAGSTKWTTFGQGS